MRYIQVDESGRLIAVADAGFRCGPGEIAVEIPAGFDKAEMRNWVLEGGTLVHRALEAAQEPDTVPTWEERLARAEAASAKLEKLLALMKENTLLKSIVEKLEEGID